MVPGTTIPITINDVINTVYSINNETPPEQEVQYDGFTTPYNSRFRSISRYVRDQGIEKEYTVLHKEK